LLGRTKSFDADDPFPVTVPGEKKPVSSAKIGDYVNAELYHYWQFYTNTKHAGSPYSGGWLSFPEWIPQLLAFFDNAVDSIKIHNENEAYRAARVKHG
jgi:hypothetical protein